MKTRKLFPIMAVLLIAILACNLPGNTGDRA